MATFLSSELDFILFFYGLAILVLASVCFAISKVRGPGGYWIVLGAFAALHGIVEWLDLAALALADSPMFAVGRTALTALSFLLLLEFARLRAVQDGLKLPGRWIYVPALLLVLAAGLYGGLASAQAVARYVLGFTGAAATALYVLHQGRFLKGGWQLWAQATATCFALYAVAAGLIVPQAPFWPASVLNQDWFVAATGLPIQLVRAIVVSALTVTVWAHWGRLLSSDIASEQYSRYLRKQFFVALGVLTAIIVVGWVLTENLGKIYQAHVEEEAQGDFDLLSGRVAAETDGTVAVARTVAAAPVALSLLAGDPGTPPDAATPLLALAVNAAGATEAILLDRTGAVAAGDKAATSRGLDPELTRIGPDGLGAVGHRFAVDPANGKPAFYASYPVLAVDGTVLGAAVVKKTLDALENDVRHFDMPYYLVDATGRIMLTNRTELLDRQLWPLAADGGSAAPAVLQDNVADGAWISIRGDRELVRREDVGSSGWSLLMIAPTKEIYASRILGIVITLLAAISTLSFLVGREHRVRESVQLDKRLQLQELARSLDVKAGTDPLTGALNRRKFDLTFAAELERAERYGTPLCVLMLDLDHFKRVNDVHGHVAGDRVLTGISRLVIDNLRQSDVLARWGGEEFVILVPGADTKMAAELAEKLRMSIAAMVFEEVGQVTGSFGGTQYRPGDTPEILLTRVDQQLYRAKSRGRNRVEIDGATSPTESLSPAA